MSIVQSLLLDGDRIAKQFDSGKKISKILRTISIFLIIFVTFLQYSNLLEYISWVKIPLWNEELRKFIKQHMFTVMCLWPIYRLIIERFIGYKLTCIHISKDLDWVPIWLTLDDLIDIGFAIYYVVYGVNLLIEFSYGYNSLVADRKICVGIILYIVFTCVKWLYIQNSNRYYNISREFTYYYDGEGKKIYKDSYVIYYGELYQVYKRKNIFTVNADESGLDWRISQCSPRWKKNDLALKEAVRDKDGGLRIEE